MREEGGKGQDRMEEERRVEREADRGGGKTEEREDIGQGVEKKKEKGEDGRRQDGGER